MNRTASSNLEPARHAFALIEAAAVSALSIILLALLIVAGSDTRRQARLGDDIAKLRDLGAATTAYAADHQDLIWSFSWKGGVTYSTPYPDLNFATTDLQAQANQAIYILRTHGNVPEAQPLNPWIANVLYSHFALAVHQRRPLPDFGSISSADKVRLQWAQNPTGTGQGPYGPYPCGGPIPTPHCHTRPRSASFQLVIAAYDGSREGSRISQHGFAHNNYLVTQGAVLGGRPLSEVAFPASKVLVSDAHARHFGVGQPYCTHDQARLPLLFADGAVTVRSASESNPGWQPNTPASPVPSQFSYTPQEWEPPTMSGAASDAVIGRFRYTRGCPTNLLAGRDFDGPEVCPPPP